MFALTISTFTSMLFLLTCFLSISIVFYHVFQFHVPEESILEPRYTVIFKMKYSSAHGSGHWSQAFCRGDPTYTSRPAHVTNVVDKVAQGQGQGQGTFKHSAFPHQYHSTRAPHTFIYHRRYIILTTDGVVKQHTLK
jgi:hypothetical protein